MSDLYAPLMALCSVALIVTDYPIWGGVFLMLSALTWMFLVIAHYSERRAAQLSHADEQMIQPMADRLGRDPKATIPPDEH